ncbi:MAG: transporter substrate-binding domain-containing protein [Paracoccaceae bacterium]|nr:MAG: transporter substrate-binding domain-containing protein [Paracoccaceae bacterium]
MPVVRALILSLALALPGHAETVRLATEAAFPPFNFINDAGDIAGFDRDFGDAMCTRAGLDCAWVVVEWDALIPQLQSGNVDVILAAMTITAERRQVVDFTAPYVPPEPSAYIARDADADLDGGLVAAQAASVHAQHVAASGAVLVEFPTTDDVVAAVLRGEADAGFADQRFLSETAAGSGGALILARSGVPLGEGFGLALRKSDTGLRGQIDAAIAGMKRDGSLNALLLKWFGEDVPTF